MSYGYAPLFLKAKDAGLRLNQLTEMCNGVFRCNWRTNDDANEPWFSHIVEHADPMCALKDALDLALINLERRKSKPAVQPGFFD